MNFVILRAVVPAHSRTAYPFSRPPLIFRPQIFFQIHSHAAGHSVIHAEIAGKHALAHLCLIKAHSVIPHCHSPVHGNSESRCLSVPCRWVHTGRHAAEKICRQTESDHSSYQKEHQKACEDILQHHPEKGLVLLCQRIADLHGVTHGLRTAALRLRLTDMQRQKGFHAVFKMGGKFFLHRPFLPLQKGRKPGEHLPDIFAFVHNSSLLPARQGYRALRRRHKLCGLRSRLAALRGGDNENMEKMVFPIYLYSPC